MIYKTEKDIEGLKKWCETQEFIKSRNYTHSFCEIENDNLLISYSYSNDDVPSFVYFRICFTEEALFELKKMYNVYYTNTEHYIILLSDILSEIRVNKINSLLNGL